METTPCKPKSKQSLAIKRAKSDATEISNEPSYSNAIGGPSNTPTFKKIPNEDEESPTVYTQELSNGIDVVWDWNSPQDKRRFKKKKRLNLESPKVPLRRYPSNTQVQTFEKLREELQALREEIALPENEECLVLSPMDETEYKSESNIEESVVDDPMEHEPEALTDDLFFDDSLDEQLVLFSQRVETEILESKPANEPLQSKQISKLARNVPRMIEESDALDDSLNNVLSQMNDNLELTQVFDLKSAVIAKSTQTYNQTNKKETIIRTKSNNDIQTSTGKFEFCRTHSFELANQRAEVVLSKRTQEEIERKRLEALAKREQKRKQQTQTYSPSPSKCSPEEIEKKRLQALAKLEAKKQNEIIERNRQEALVRLQMNRMKNANNVKSTLAKRL